MSETQGDQSNATGQVAKRQLDSIIAAIEKGFPKFLREMADETGFRIPRRKHARAKQATVELSRGFFPLLQGLATIQGPLEGNEKARSAVDQALLGMAILFGATSNSSDNPLEAYLDAVRKRIAPPPEFAEDATFKAVTVGLEALLREVIRNEHHAKEARKVIGEHNNDAVPGNTTFLLGFESRNRRNQKKPPKRLTLRAVVQLTDEYRDLAGLFEKRLKCLVCLNYLAMSKPKSYGDVAKIDLNGLLQQVDSHKNPLLSFLRGIIDRRVRNAIAHGQPALVHSKQSVRFRDLAGEVVWTIGEFYATTKQLMSAYVALLGLEITYSLLAMEAIFKKVHAPAAITTSE